MREAVDDRPRGYRSVRTQLRWTTAIPALVLVLMCVGAAWVVVFPRLELYVIGSGVQTVSVPAVPALASLQTERQKAMAYLGDPAGGDASLRQQQKQTDAGLHAMRTAAASALAGAPAEITDRLANFTGQLAKLPHERSLIATGRTTADQVFAFYNNLLDAATSLFDAQARIVPDAPITQSAIAAVSLFRDADDMSRAGSWAASALAANTFTDQGFLEFQGLVGAYHADLATTRQYLQPDVQRQYRAVVDGAAFRNLTAAENALIEQGPHPQVTTTTTRVNGKSVSTTVASFPVGAADWTNLTSAVSRQLIDLTIAQANEIAAEAAGVGRSEMVTGVVLLLAMIAATAIAVVVTFRLSRRLARRIQAVARGANELAGTLAPEIVARIHDGEEVDIAAEVPLLDDGKDEIGVLAGQIRTAWTADLTARRREILSRKGTTQVLVALARRIQIPVQRQLKTLTGMQRTERDPEVVDLLFALDHETTRTRRIADNLIILGGGRLDRKVTRPVALIDIVRQAAAETSEYQRFEYGRFPEDTRVHPAAATSLTHMISELMDNAVVYSPRDSQVRVRATVTGRGVAVEIEDMGRGLDDEEFERLNARMADPPEFDAMAPEPAVKQLGTFVVARLAAELGVHVAFRPSPYRGVAAIVAIPNTLLTESDVPAETVAAPPVATPAADDPPPERSRHARTPEPTEITGTLPVGTVAEPTAVPARNGLPALPKRQRGAHLAVGLQAGLPAQPQHAAAVPDTASLEGMREQMSGFQRGSVLGRRAAESGHQPS